MKYFFLFFLFVCCGKNAFAQWSNLQKDAATYVYADTAYIRSNPSTANPAADMLFAGDLIKVIAPTEKMLTVKGIKAPWLQVSYTKNNLSKTGYIWSGALSPVPLRKGDIKIVYGCNYIYGRDSVIEGYKQKVYFYMLGIKVYQQGKKLAYTQRTLLYDSTEFEMSADAAVTSGKGLKDVSLLIEISFGGQACAIPLEKYYYAFRRNEIVPLYKTFSVSDAGSYYNTETLTFPADKGGKPDMILWKQETGEATDKMDKNGEPVFKEHKKSRQFSWNGTALTEIRKTK